MPQETAHELENGKGKGEGRLDSVAGCSKPERQRLVVDVRICGGVECRLGTPRYSFFVTPSSEVTKSSFCRYKGKRT